MKIVKDIYIHKKEIDWSSLNLGINIPVSIQVVFHNLIKQRLKKGDTKDIKIIIDEKSYDAKLVNIKFDEKKYPTHKELIQIRYTPTSEISQKLKSVFYASFEYLKIEKEKLVNKRQHIDIPDNLKEYLVLYTTEFDDVYLMDCITNDDINITNKDILSISEEEFELSVNYSKRDTTADILLKPQLVKMRKLDKSISDNLKLLYDFKCQVCGESIGDKYDGIVTEAHHIEPFAKSLNNNSDNILVVCPNHHRIIHKTNAEFEKQKLSYIYPNGLEEKLALNYHL